VSQDKKLDDIDADQFDLVVGRKGSFISSELVVAPAPAAVEVDTAALCSTLNNLIVTFQRMGEDRPFALQFRKTDNILTAKTEVARYLHLPGPDRLTLAFKGRPLREAFILSKLRIGDSPIIVHVKDATALLLVTGGSGRRHSGAEPP
jgi:hypothetical protein